MTSLIQSIPNFRKTKKKNIPFIVQFCGKQIKLMYEFVANLNVNFFFFLIETNFKVLFLKDSFYKNKFIKNFMISR